MLWRYLRDLPLLGLYIAHRYVEQKKLNDLADEESRQAGSHPERRTASNREELAEALRVNILSQVRRAIEVGGAI